MPKTSKEERLVMAAIDSWLRNVQATGAAKSTVEDYAGVMNAFYAFLVESGLSTQPPTFTTIQAYRDSLLGRGLSPVTVKYHLVILRSFFDYASAPELGDHRFYEQNPVSLYLMPATRKQESRPYDVLLTDEQVCKLWRNSPIRTTHPENWPRNYAIVILLLTTEIRNSELRSLTLEDVDLEGAVLRVEHGKGDKFRRVDMPSIAVTALRQYLQSPLRPASLPDSAPLFGTLSSGQWKSGSKQWLSDLVERHVRSVTGVSDIRSHDLRHVGSRLDLNAGMAENELQSKLGHSSPLTTQRYSGRLLTRSGRKSAAQVVAERDLQARRNQARLDAAAQPPTVQ